MRNILIILMLIISINIFSEEVQESWVNTVPELSGLKLITDPFNYIYVLSKDFSVLKYNEDGDLLWIVNYENALEAIDITL